MSDATKQPNEVKHSPLPWRVKEYRVNGVTSRFVEDANGKPVDKSGAEDVFTEANADLIVQRVNMHDEPVAACRAALEEDAAPENPGGILTEATRDQLRAALARAGQAVPS